MAESLIAMTAPTSLRAVDIRVVGMQTGTGAVVNYVTLPQNQPKSYGNTIYVWKTTSNVVPWSKTPEGVTAVSSNAPVSTQKVDFPFEVGQGYIVGYAVAADPSTTCATVYIPADGVNDPTKYTSDNTKLEFIYAGNNVVQVRFDGLPNYSPAQNGNWIGIWQLDHVPYQDPPAPLGTAPINSELSKGAAVIQGVRIVIGSVYSVGYFMAAAPAGRRALAASVTFQT